jgi:hypothetical protein
VCFFCPLDLPRDLELTSFLEAGPPPGYLAEGEEGSPTGVPRIAGARDLPCKGRQRFISGANL